MGGKRSIFQLEIPKNSPLVGNLVYLDMGNNMPLELEELSLTREFYRENYEFFNKIARSYEKYIVTDNHSNKCYFINRNSLKLLDESPYHIKGNFNQYSNFKIFKSGKQTPKSAFEENFSCFVFDKDNSNTQDVLNLLKGMQLDNSGWRMVEFNSQFILTRAKDTCKFEITEALGYRNRFNKTIFLH